VADSLDDWSSHKFEQPSKARRRVEVGETVRREVSAVVERPSLSLSCRVEETGQELPEKEMR
jgi:hypothetical protein